MPSPSDAINALKVKLAQAVSASKPVDETVSLANYTAMGVAKYIWHDINVDWNPTDHPRDPHTGEFVSTPGGYIWGKAKSADFPGKHFKLSLKPGDIAYKSPAGNAIIAHPDDTFTLVDASTGKSTALPADSHLAHSMANGDAGFTKIAENPGIKVEAKSEQDAKYKLSDPKGFETTHPADPQVTKSVTGQALADMGTASKPVPEKPKPKAGKTTLTAKQIEQWKSDTAGLPFAGPANAEIKGGDWVDFEGKPYQVWPSPYEDHGVLSYKWVSTKMQASNLPHYDDFDLNGLIDSAHKIEDPTGSPYGVDAPVAPSLEHGGLTKAQTTGIPPTATAYLNHMKSSKGSLITDGVGNAVTDSDVVAISGGDWLEIDGQPVQVHASPNPGMVAVSKWIKKKQKASSMAYDFPVSVIHTGKWIADPTGSEYVPLENEDATNAPVSEPAGDGMSALVNSLLSTINTGSDLATWENAPVGAKTEAVEPNAGKPLQKFDNGLWGLNKGWLTADQAKVQTEVWAQIAPNPTAHQQPTSVSENEVIVLEAPSASDYLHLLDGTQPFTMAGDSPAVLGVYAGAPKNTVVHSETSAGETFYTAQGDGQWAVAGTTVGLTWNSPGHPLMWDPNAMTAIKEPEFFPPASGKHVEINNNPFNLPAKDAITLDGIAYSKRGMDWTTSGGSVVGDAQTVAKIEAATSARKYFLHQVAAMYPGQTLVTTSKVLGTVTAYSMDENGSFNNGHGTKVDVNQLADAIWKQWDKFNIEIKAPAVDTSKHEETGLPDHISVGAEGYVLNNGFDYPLKPGDKVVKDNNDFVIAHPDGSGEGLISGETHSYQFSPDWSLNATNKIYFEVPQTEADKEVDPAGDQFIHPVSGAHFDLHPGDVVYKHKADNGGYIIKTTDPETPINFFTTNGKLQKPKAAHKGLDTNYEAVDVWPGKQSNSTKPTIAGISATGSSYATQAITGDKLVHPYTDETFVYVASLDGWVLEGTDDGSTYAPELVKAWYDNPAADDTTGWLFVPKDQTWSTDNAAVPQPTTATTPSPVSAALDAPAAPQEIEPHTFLFPSGKKGHVNPGSMLVKFPQPSGDIYYIGVSPGSGSNNVYDGNGNLVGFGSVDPSVFSLTPTQAKKWVKQNKLLGAEILDDFPMPSTKAKNAEIEEAAKNVDLPTEHDLTSIYEQYWYGSKPSLPGNGNPFPGKPTYLWHSVPIGDTTWGAMGTDGQVAFVAGYTDLSVAGWAKYNDAFSWDGLPSDKKSFVTKMRNAYGIVYRMGRLAQEIQNPDTTWSEDDFTTEIAFLNSKYAKPNAALGSAFGDNFPYTTLVDSLVAGNASRKFKQTLSGLGFDPYNASTEELDTYAKTQGFSHLAALEPEMQKQWVLASLGDPGQATSTKDAAQKAAASVQTKIDVLALSNKLAKPQVKPVATIPVIKGLVTKSDFQTQYSWSGEGSVSITHVGPDEWSVVSTPTTGSPQTLTFSDPVVQALVNGAYTSGTNVHTSGKPAYGAPNAEDTLAAWSKHYGVEDWKNVTPEQTVDIGLGLTAGQKMSQQERTQWVLAHANGDVLLQALIQDPAALSKPYNKVAAQAFVAKTSGFITDYTDPSPIKQKWVDAWHALYGADANPDFMGGVAFWRSQILDHGAEFNAFKQQLAEPGSAEQPSDVSDSVWSLVSDGSATDFESLYAGTPWASVTDAALNNAVKSTNYATGISALMLPSLPDPVKRLAAWANDGKSYDPVKMEIFNSIVAKANAGVYLTDETPVWFGPDGSKYPISPGATVFNVSGDYYIGTPNDGGGWSSVMKINGAGQATAAPSYTANYFTDESKVFTLPDAMTWEKAKADHPEFMPILWEAVQEIEDGKSTQYASPLVGPEAIAELVKDKAFQKNYPHLFAQRKALPTNVLQGVIAAKDQNNGDPILSMLEYKASAGHYASMQTKGLYDPQAPWLKNLSLGQVTQSDIAAYWEDSAKQAYADQFGLTDVSQIPEHLNSLLHPDVEAPLVALPAFKDLQLTKTSKSLGGMHSKNVWVDQDGNEWMTKGFPSDPNSKARVEAEAGAMRISRLFGFHSPVATTQNVHGDYVYLQHLAPVNSPQDFTGLGPNDLSMKHLQQAMSEHVLDWIVSNHDTHEQNLMFGADGNILGVDLGQAFKFFPDDKLAVGYLPPGNGAPVWYDKFYKGVINGSVTKEKADEVTKAVLRTAQRVSKDKDADYRAELETALGNRDFWPAQFPTREQFIDGLVERKHDTFDTFVKFYKDLYAKSPYSWDIDTENLTPPKIGQAHIAVTQEYVDDVVKAKTVGQAIFFAGDDLEDSHLLMSVAKAKNGSTVLTGEAKVRAAGDAALQAWLKKQTITGGMHQSAVSAPEPVDDYEAMPGSAQWFNALVQGSKTVSHHNKQGDTQYNESTLAQEKAAYLQIEKAHAELTAWETKHPGELFHSPVGQAGNMPAVDVQMFTTEQQAAWKSMLETYIDYHNQIEAKKNTSEKITPYFTQPIYKASPSAKKEFEAQKSGSTADAVQEEVTTTDVKVGTKVLKVTYKPSSISDGQINLDTGDLELNGGTSTKFQTGHMYEIDFGDSVVTYRPWNSDVALTQQGLLRFEKKDWDSDPTSISEIFDVLRHMGLNLDPADETSMQLFYWKHLTGVLGNRKGGGTGKWGQVLKDTATIDQSLSRQEQLDAYKEAWAKAIGQEKVDAADWMPHFGALSPHSEDMEHVSGHPFWYRPDVTISDLKKAYASTQGSSTPVPPASSFKNNDAVNIALSGAALSTEERARYYGQTAKSGMSSTEDQNYGSGAQVYTRQNMGYQSMDIWYDPRIALRTSSYAFGGDTFGDITKKSNNSPWDIAQSGQFNNSGNELMVKNAVAVADGVVMMRFNSAADRNKAIALYKKLGINSILGVPIEDAFTVGYPSDSQKKEAFSKMWAFLEAQQQSQEQAA